MAVPLRVLILEDRPADAELMVQELRKAGFAPEWKRVETKGEYLAGLSPDLDVILADYHLPQFDAPRALALLQERQLDVPFIVVTGSISEEVAVECIKQGASDYLLKDRMARLGAAVATALNERKIRGERYRARETLRDTNQFLTALIQASPLAIILTDSSWRIRSWNLAAERLFGWAEREVMGRPLPRVLGGSREEFRNLGKRLVRGELLDGVELRHHRKDGLPIDVSFWGAALYAATGRIHRILAIIADITERKRAEGTLRRSELLNRSLVEHIPLRIFVKDRDSVYVSCNTLYAHDLGVEPEQIAGKDDFAFFPRELAEQYRADDQTVITSGTLKDTDEKFQVAGEERWVHTIKVPYRDQQGGVHGVLGIFDDITERKKMEEELRRSEERFRVLFDFAPDAYYLHDVQGILVDGNRVAEDLIGYKRDELIGSSFQELKLVREDQLEKAAGLLAANAAGSPAGPDELVLVRRDGMEIPIEIRTVPMKIGDQTLVLGIARDITERKRREKELKDSMERLRKAMGGTVRAMALTVESKDPYTAGHQQRVANLARAIAQEMGLPRDRVDGIRMAGAIHDVGKVSVPAEILSKPGRITEIEFGIIKTHSQVGYDILKNIDFPWPIADMVLQHHEKMNGTGYPLGLSGDAIMLEARVLVVADVVEAMVSHRPYRPALGIDSALDEISKNRGVLYDPDAVGACLRLFREKGFEFG